MKRSSTFTSGVGSNSGTTGGAPDQPNQPLLGGGGSGGGSGSVQSNNGFLASRVYCNVPANIIAQAMQRRDEDEKKEIERMMPIARHRSSRDSNRGAVMVQVQDKSMQTVPLRTNGERGDMLCARCGADLEPEPSGGGPVDSTSSPDIMDSSNGESIGGVISVMNLLDLSEPIAPPPPAPIGPSNTSLLLDLLGGPLEGDNSEEGEKSNDNISLTDLMMDTGPLPAPMDSKSSIGGSGSDDLSSPQKLTPTPAGSISSLDAISVSSSTTSKESKPATPSNATSLLPEAEAAAAATVSAQNSLFAKVNMSVRRSKATSQRNNNNDNDIDEINDNSTSSSSGTDHEQQHQQRTVSKTMMTSDPNDSPMGNSGDESIPTSANSLEDLSPSPPALNNSNKMMNHAKNVDNRRPHHQQTNGAVIHHENDNEKLTNSTHSSSRGGVTTPGGTETRRDMKGLAGDGRRDMKGLITNSDRRDQVRKPGKASNPQPPKGGPAHLYLQTSV